MYASKRYKLELPDEIDLVLEQWKAVQKMNLVIKTKDEFYDFISELYYIPRKGGHHIVSTYENNCDLFFDGLEVCKSDRIEYTAIKMTLKDEVLNWPVKFILSQKDMIDVIITDFTCYCSCAL